MSLKNFFFTSFADKFLIESMLACLRASAARGAA